MYVVSVGSAPGYGGIIRPWGSNQNGWLKYKCRDPQAEPLPCTLLRQNGWSDSVNVGHVGRTTMDEDEYALAAAQMLARLYRNRD